MALSTAPPAGHQERLAPNPTSRMDHSDLLQFHFFNQNEIRIELIAERAAAASSGILSSTAACGNRLGATLWLSIIGSPRLPDLPNLDRSGLSLLKRLTSFQQSRIREPATMSFVRSALVAAAVLGVAMSGVALAQTTPPSSISSKVDDVSKWTSKQWNQAKAKWAKEKEKWADCQKQSKDQNLTGRKSWSFLASCMTS